MPVTGRDQPTRFVILSTQRSGSNWVEERIASHPDVGVVPSEPFRRTGNDPQSFRAFRRTSTRRRLAAALAPPVAKAAFLGSAMPDQRRAVGFRLMYNQLRRNPSLGALLLARRFHVVHLVRANVLAAHVSALTARATGVYVTRDAAAESPTVHVPVETLAPDLRRRLAEIDRHRRLLDRSRLATLEVRYEDYVSEPDTWDARILDHLCVPIAGLGTTLQRQAPDDLAARIENLDEVRAALEANDLDWLLRTGSAEDQPSE